MHLLVFLAVLLDVDHHGRKDAGDAGRSDEHVAEEFARLLPPAACDGAHVPDHGFLAIEVGRGDQQRAAVGGFARDGEHKLVGHESFDQMAQRLAIEDADVE